MDVGSLLFKTAPSGLSSVINNLLGASDAAAARSAIGAHRIPAGMTGYFGGSSPPTGWLKANGASLSRTAYADLFAAIGTTYGSGDGSTTFDLPDLRGEFLRAWDDGRGVDAARAVGSYQADQLKTHGHTISARSNSTSFGQLNGFARPSNSGSNFDLPDVYSLGPSDGGAETRPRNVALLAIIKY